MPAEFNDVIRTFTRKHRIDVINGKTRANYRSIIQERRDSVKLGQLRKSLKGVPTDNLSTFFPNPITVFGYSALTPIQEVLIKHSTTIHYGGAYAYNCSCGAGKTVAGLLMVHMLQCRTLIISSRNSINDQWLSSIRRINPDLIWLDQEGLHNTLNPNVEPDIIILTPQYLTKSNRIETFPMNPSLIIYDEVHSLMSDEYINVLLLPFIRVINNQWPELPLMIAMSATFPESSMKNDVLARRRLNIIFGNEYYAPSAITNIPVHVWDYRDTIPKRGFCDCYYEPIYRDLPTCMAMFCKLVSENPDITVSNRFKGLVIAREIDETAYAACRLQEWFHVSVAILRQAGEQCIILPADVQFEASLTLAALKQQPVRYGNETDIGDCSIIVGTVSRLREGFSLQSLTWGICIQFPWSLSGRIQILGRIRRSSDDETLNKQPRIFYVCSGRIPSNLKLRQQKVKKVNYDEETERRLFKNENYIRISSPGVYTP